MPKSCTPLYFSAQESHYQGMLIKHKVGCSYYCAPRVCLVWLLMNRTELQRVTCIKSPSSVGEVSIVNQHVLCTCHTSCSHRSWTIVSSHIPVH